jgi:hypothetical protein
VSRLLPSCIHPSAWKGCSRKLDPLAKKHFVENSALLWPEIHHRFIPSCLNEDFGKENVHIDLPEKEERSHERELISFNGHLQIGLIYTTANEESSL